MKINIIKWLSLSLLTATLITGCTKTFDEINTDPDALSTVPATNILGDVLRTTTTQQGGDMDGYGTFAGVHCKNSISRRFEWDLFLTIIHTGIVGITVIGEIHN